MLSAFSFKISRCKITFLYTHLTYSRNLQFWNHYQQPNLTHHKQILHYIPLLSQDIKPLEVDRYGKCLEQYYEIYLHSQCRKRVRFLKSFTDVKVQRVEIKEWLKNFQNLSNGWRVELLGVWIIATSKRLNSRKQKSYAR